MPRRTQRQSSHNAGLSQSAPSPLPSLQSSPESFITAAASPRDPSDTPPDPGTPNADASDTTFLRARQLPPELKQHCQIYLEESLPLISLNLLNNLHSSQSSAYCPPSSQLAFLCGIALHPDFTSRPKEPSWPQAGAESLDYLHNILSTIGPINAHFDEAFRFASATKTRWPREESPSDDSDPDDMNGGDNSVTGKYVTGSVWSRGQDFFSVVGWAFNCSVLYPSRWRHYKPWLEFMFDMLEADLHERFRLDTDSGNEECPMLKRSVLAGYVAQRGGRAAGGGLKFITKAIFASGDKGAHSLFQEIWNKEHKGMSIKALNKRKRAAVNLEKGEYGGWLDDESVSSSQGSEPPTPQKRRTSSSQDAGSPDFQGLEDTYAESIPFRHQLFSLLSFLSCYLPSAPFELPDLYEIFERTVKELPLPIFTEMIDNTAGKLREDSHISLLQGVLSLLMPSSALSPVKVDKVRGEQGGTSPAILERCFLPYAANTIVPDDNAKVSLLLEGLMRIIIMDGRESFSLSLLAIVQKGVDARQAKANRKKTRGRPTVTFDDPEAEARMVLELSGQRLLMLAGMVDFDTNHGQDVEMGSDEEEDAGDATFMTANDHSFL